MNHISRSTIEAMFGGMPVWPVLLKRAALLLLAMLLGTAIALLGPRYGLLLLLPVLAGTALLLALMRQSSVLALALGVALLLHFLLPLLFKLSGIRLFNHWQLLVLLLALPGLGALAREAVADGVLRASLFCFALLLLLLGLSTVLNAQAHVAASVYQLLSDLKPVLLLGLGFALLQVPNAPRGLWWVLRWAWLPLVGLVAWQWLAPGLYGRVFNFPQAPILAAQGLLPSRALGWYEHSGMLGGFAAMMGLLALLRALHLPEQRHSNWALVLIYSALLLASGQRAELASLLAVALLAVVCLRPDRLVARVLLVLPILAVLAAAFWFFFGDTLMREASMWGGSRYAPVEHPRALLYEGASYLANKHFPLGSGLGTYGGAGAVKFDQSLYYSLGFSQYWWFRDEDYLLDVFWQNVLAEGGWVALGVQVLQYLLLAGYALRQYARSAGLQRVLWGGAGFGVLFLMANSTVSPTFQDPRLFVWAALCVGLAVQQRQLDGERVA